MSTSSSNSSEYLPLSELKIKMDTHKLTNDNIVIDNKERDCMNNGSKLGESNESLNLINMDVRPTQDSQNTCTNNTNETVNLMDSKPTVAVNDMQNCMLNITTMLHKMQDSFDKLQVSVDGTNRVISELKQELKSEIGELRTEIKAELEIVNDKVKVIENDHKMLEEKVDGMDSNIKGNINDLSREFNDKISIVDSKVKLLSDGQDNIKQDLVLFKDGIDQFCKLQIDKEISCLTDRVNTKIVSLSESYLVEFHGDGEKLIHPMNFVKYAKKFSDTSCGTWESNKLILLKYLKGNANAWGRDIIMYTNSFDDFENAFKRRFWNKTIQRKFESKLAGDGDFVDGNTDLIAYVMKYYESNLHLDKPLLMEEFIDAIVRHLPTRIGMGLAAAKEIDTRDELERLLIRLVNIPDQQKSLGLNEGGRTLNRRNFEGRERFGNSQYHNGRYQGRDNISNQKADERQHFNDHVNRKYDDRYRDKGYQDRQESINHYKSFNQRGGSQEKHRYNTDNEQKGRNDDNRA